MTSKKTIESAIERSISHNEIVRVEVEWPKTRQSSSAEEIILDWVDAIEGVDDVDCAQENDGTYDVWGTRNGDNWRIRIA